MIRLENFRLEIVVQRRIYITIAIFAVGVAHDIVIIIVIAIQAIAWVILDMTNISGIHGDSSDSAVVVLRVGPFLRHRNGIFRAVRVTMTRCESRV